MGIGRALLIAVGLGLLSPACTAVLRRPKLDAGRWLALRYARWVTAHPGAIEWMLLVIPAGVVVSFAVSLSRVHATPQSFEEAGRAFASIVGILFALAVIFLRKWAVRACLWQLEGLHENPGPAWPYLLILLLLTYVGAGCILIGVTGYQST